MASSKQNGRLSDQQNTLVDSQSPDKMTRDTVKKLYCCIADMRPGGGTVHSSSSNFGSLCTLYYSHVNKKQQ